MINKLKLFLIAFRISDVKFQEGDYLINMWRNEQDACILRGEILDALVYYRLIAAVSTP